MKRGTYKFDDNQFNMKGSFPCLLIDDRFALYIDDEDKNQVLYLTEVVPMDGQDGIYTEHERLRFINLGKIFGNKHSFPSLEEIAIKLSSISAFELLTQHYDYDHERFTLEDWKQKSHPERI